MKKLLLLTILISLVAGCHRIHDELAGSGKRQKQTRDVSAFTSISTEGAFDIEVVCQKPRGLEIEGDDNVLPLISTEVSNNVLHIKSLRGYSVREPVTVKISIESLEGISASGAGAINVSGLKNEKFGIESSGAPEIKAAGQTKTLNIDATGAGKIDAHRLAAERAVVEAKGVAQIEVDAEKQLDVTISGPSHVSYSGDPIVNKTIHGPGSLEKKRPEVN